MATYRELLEQQPGTDELTRLVLDLRTDKDALVSYYAIIKTLISSEFFEKVENSYSGHVLHFAFGSILRGACMAIDRIWDGSGLPGKGPPKGESGSRLLYAINAVDSQLEMVTDLLLNANPPPDPFPHFRWRDHYVQSARRSLKVTSRRAESFFVSQNRARIRVFRSENIAHRLRRSRDRKMLHDPESEISIPINELLAACRVTIKVVDRLIYLWLHEHDSSGDAIRNRILYAKAFVDALPVFSEVEKLG